MIVAFSTASSEAAFPRTVEVLEKFGVRPRVTASFCPSATRSTSTAR